MWNYLKAEEDFITGCKNNDISKVSHVLKEIIDQKNKFEESLIAGYMHACEYNNVEILKLLDRNVFYREIYEKRLEKNEIRAVTTCCERNTLDVLKYLVNTRRYDYDIDFKKSERSYESMLCTAAQRGHLEIVDYLLTTTDTMNIAQYDDEGAYHSACYYDKLEVVKYLLSSPRLKKHIDKSIDDDRAFYIACNADTGINIPLLEYLIIDEDLQMTSHMEDYLKLSPSKKSIVIYSIFAKKQLNEKLKTTLTHTPQDIKLVKI